MPLAWSSSPRSMIPDWLTTPSAGLTTERRRSVDRPGAGLQRPRKEVVEGAVAREVGPLGLGHVHPVGPGEGADERSADPARLRRRERAGERGRACAAGGSAGVGRRRSWEREKAGRVEEREGSDGQEGYVKRRRRFSDTPLSGRARRPRSDRTGSRMTAIALGQPVEHLGGVGRAVADADRPERGARRPRRRRRATLRRAGRARSSGPSARPRPCHVTTWASTR